MLCCLSPKVCQIHFVGHLPRAFTRASVEKSSSLLKISLRGLTTSQNMQIVDDGAPTQIKEVFTQSTIACASSLPLTNMGKGCSTATRSRS